MTNEPNNTAFKYYAHQRGSSNKDVFYLGAYPGVKRDNKLRSISGVTLSNTEDWTDTVAVLRAGARANGTSQATGNGNSGYDLWAWYQLLYCQCMYVLKYRNLNSQETLSQGCGYYEIGIGNQKGMNWTDPTTKLMKMFGVEYWWGSISWIIDGIFKDENHYVKTATENFNNTATGYKSIGRLLIDGAVPNTGTSDVYGWQSKAYGTPDWGFMGSSISNGSSSTYYCDEFFFNQGGNKTCFWGASWHGSAPWGMFHTSLKLGVEEGKEGKARGRLMYL